MHNSCSNPQRFFFQFSQLSLSTHTKFKGVMNGLALLMLALFAQVNAFHNRSNFTEEFHTILEKAAEIKKITVTSEDFMIAVRYAFPVCTLANSGIYNPLS